MDNSFNNLSTLEVNNRCQPYMNAIYSHVFPQCIVSRNPTLHEDRDLGIDARITLSRQSVITIQEKCREYQFYHYLEFTQEFYNASGTTYEREGEWFHFVTNLYFYGWENKTKTGFEAWAILDVMKYKLFVEQAGGLDQLGILKSNNKHGAANFYAIPMQKLAVCFIAKGWKDKIEVLI